MCNLRIGFGEDTHRLREGRRLVLGGAEIPYRLGLLGHSDADALCHAIIDALLGAAALGDIGRHFPDTDERFKDADSLMLLARIAEALDERGYNIVNTDSVIIAQEPKMAPYIEGMRENLSRALRIDISCVSVKATTPERTGAEGNLECITVRSVVLAEKRQ